MYFLAGFVSIFLCLFQGSVNSNYDNDYSFIIETQEDEFQQSMDTLFDSSMFYDTTLAWSTKVINSGYFDPAVWNDTARIVLIDSSKCKYFIHPFKNYITSDFGQRKYVWHDGIDIKLFNGDTVRAAFDGIVRVSKNDKHGYGIVVVLRHADGLETIYAHLSKTKLVPNSVIKAGDIVGFGGNTGRSTGSHLHFEMRYYGQSFNPNCIIDFENYTLRYDTLILTKDDFQHVKLEKIVWHVIKKGETLGHIAIKYNTKVYNLCKLNRMSTKTILRPGKKIIVRLAKRTDELIVPICRR